MHIYVYDSVSFGSVLDSISGTSLVVHSIADMVTKVLAATEGQSYKSDLFFMGEGFRNYQSVGAGSNFDSTGNRSLQTNVRGELLGDARTMLPQINERIGVIHLMGLDDYGNREASRLMAAVAQTLEPGGRVSGNHSLVIYHGNNARIVRPEGGRALFQRNSRNINLN